VNFIPNFIKQNPYPIESDIESIERIPLLEEEGPLDVLCVFEEETWIGPCHSPPITITILDLAKSNKKPPGKEIFPLHAYYARNPII